MEEIKAFNQEKGVETHFLTIEGDTYIVMFFPYNPNVAENNEIFIDNYYPAYQRLREVKLQLKDLLIQKGYIIDNNSYYYKDLALKTGKVKRLKNTLTAHPMFGSFFTIEVIKIKGEYGAPEPLESQNFMLCEKCTLCEKACPGKAIGESFCQNRCIRDLQIQGYIEDSTCADYCGNRVWGCNICQIVCPANANIIKKPFVDEDLLNSSVLYQSAISGRQGMGKYAEIMGSNYARPVKMLALLINALTNSGDTKFYKEISQLVDHNDQRIRNASLRYIERVQK